MLIVIRYHVPTYLEDHIQFITPGIGSSYISKPNKRVQDLQKRADDICIPPPNLKNYTLNQCSEGALPQCLNALYGIPEVPILAPNNDFGIVEVNVTYIESDMELFFKHVAPNIPPNTKARDVLINGVNMTKNFDDTAALLSEEADLDFQLAWPLIYPGNITLLATLPSSEQFQQYADANLTTLEAVNLETVIGMDDIFSSFDKVSHYVKVYLILINFQSFCYNEDNNSPCGLYEAPKVLSISYVNYEFYTPEAVLKRWCSEALKLGLQGTTILVSSGDSGTALRDNMCGGTENSTFVPNGLAA
jgi:tripeptidyl-peptidase I